MDLGRSHCWASSQFRPRWTRKAPPGAWNRWAGLRTPARPTICPDSRPVCPGSPSSQPTICPAHWVLPLAPAGPSGRDGQEPEPRPGCLDGPHMALLRGRGQHGPSRAGGTSQTLPHSRGGQRGEDRRLCPWGRRKPHISSSSPEAWVGGPVPEGSLLETPGPQPSPRPSTPTQFAPPGPWASPSSPQDLHGLRKKSHFYPGPRPGQAAEEAGHHKSQFGLQGPQSSAGPTLATPNCRPPAVCPEETRASRGDPPWLQGISQAFRRWQPSPGVSAAARAPPRGRAMT